MKTTFFTISTVVFTALLGTAPAIAMGIEFVERDGITVVREAPGNMVGLGSLAGHWSICADHRGVSNWEK
ncbi:hypothetical protein CHU98_g4293 [Xylaria longipes]|nr:hypothetical protein CHU98_g4293 [Xylaria longipes]